MENPNLSHQNSDSFNKKKLSLTSPVYKDFGKPLVVFSALNFLERLWTA